MGGHAQKTTGAWSRAFLLVVVAILFLVLSADAGSTTSRRGKRLVTMIQPISATQGTLYVSDLDGSRRQKLVRGGQPQLSPDGRNLLFSAHGGLTLLRFGRDLHVIDARGGSGYAWAPDSKHFAYVTSTCPTCGEVRIGDVRSPKTVAVGPFEDLPQRISFSPNSRKLAFDVGDLSKCSKRRQFVYVARTAGGVARRITTDGCSSSPAWGRKGIALSRCTQHKGSGGLPALVCQIWMIRADGRNLRQLSNLRVTSPFIYGLFPREWSKDGAHLLAVYSGQDTCLAYGVDAPSGRLWDLRSAGVPEGISRDGRYVLTVGGTCGDGPWASSGAYRIPFHGGARTLLIHKAGRASWNR